MNIASRVKFIAILVTLSFLSVGCATGPKPHSLDIQLKDTENSPEASTTVVISEVVDTRKFSSDPLNPAIPQIFSEEGNAPSLTERSFATVWSASGKPIFDYMLPDDRKVTDLVSEALANAFRQAGFEVVETGGADAIPVTAEILRFWSWNTGTWAFNFHFETDVLIKAPITPFENGKSVSGKMRLKSTWAAGPSQFTNTIVKGLDDFTVNFIETINQHK